MSATQIAIPAIVQDIQVNDASSRMMSDMARPAAVDHRMKRVIDVMISSLALAFLVIIPLLPLLALLVMLDGGPVLFSHRRIGIHNKPFGCLKFRTMRVNAEQALAEYLAVNPVAASEWEVRRKLHNDPRVTRWGSFLRATSLDELPQLINVLRGEMSLIGPRPVVLAELEEKYCAAGRTAYVSTRPGITGLWQISGRSDTSYAERVRLDIAYVSTWSLQQDLLILTRTIPAVLSRRGAV